MNDKPDNEQELQQWTLRWESNKEDQALAEAIFQRYRYHPPAQQILGEMSQYLLKKEALAPALLYEVFLWFHERKETHQLKQLADRWKKTELTEEKDYESYIQYLRDTGDFVQALQILEETMNRFSAQDRFFLLHLELLIDSQQFQKALSLLSVQKCKELKDPECYLIRAKLLFQDSSPAPSIRDEIEYLCLEALRLDTQKVDAFFLLLDLYTFVFKLSSKINFLFKLAQSYHIQDLSLFREILSALLIVNEVNDAEEIYTVLRELLPTKDLPVMDLVLLLHLKLNNIGLARQLWKEYRLRGATDHPQLYIIMGQICEILLQQNRLWQNTLSPKTEDSVWAKALTIPSDGMENLLQTILLYSYDCLMELEPDSPEFYYLKGLCLADRDPKNASLLFRKTLDLSPDYTMAHFELAQLYQANHEYLKAYESYRKILQSNYTDIDLFMETYMQLSEISIKFGWIEEAERYLDLAKQMSPMDYRVHLSLGKIYLKESKIIGSEVALDKAEYHLQQVIDLVGQQGEAMYFLGQAAYAKRQFLPAIKYYSDAVSSGLLNERGEAFATEENCFLWISRSYYQLYKDMLFSSRDYLMEAIVFAEKMKVDQNSNLLLLEYILELYEMANMKEQANKVNAIIVQLKSKKQAPIFENADQMPGIIKILTVFSPISDEDQEQEKAIFSKGHIGEIQSILIPGEGQIKITGNVSESFTNAVKVAFGFARHFLFSMNMSDALNQQDLLIDFPGWYPRYDGTSAGSSIAISILSAFLKKAVPRNVTITGEITLLGDVLPVAGIKEKIEATMEKQIDIVFIPKDNRWDYLDMVLKGGSSLKFPEVIAVSNVKDIVKDLFKISIKT